MKMFTRAAEGHTAGLYSVPEGSHDKAFGSPLISLGGRPELGVLMAGY